MSETRSPRETLHALLDGITAGRFTELVELYAEDIVVETPLEPGGPGRFEGRKVLAERFAQVGEHSPLELSHRNVVVRETDDPEVIVAEWDYEVRHRTTGRSLTAANIQVLRVRDGLIVHSRDFHDHLALAALTGTLPQLVAALEAE
ncbi:nuclear transport factor 2 family protein [Kitasatospora purpeofusca]|uniref:nuclear transport factor 2 family protein n=1 Tax=Kitasatospora purpeofusca TaxID=67352 RepID=UPI002251567A|nr:nuclear transport factor 2 family protein [Kitasatospora purpeofusca]MCX4683965.1 nuclear transport factor 2 family protein [Kitasatospora purpeofusca]MCX4758955.1 nuclear transport factor 2 family protein [Kitasatospora purpeofusca]WSR30624.1 nuclear transport factor 2 family protein [Kitasatospora purpeofusca]WSR38862.1 nuclear transport factor 2 family protein [Kitasatospora purpeofusca]